MGIGNRLITPRLTLTTAKNNKNRSIPTRTVFPAYSAMVSGPLIFLGEISSCTILTSIFIVTTDINQTLSTLRKVASTGP